MTDYPCKHSRRAFLKTSAAAGAAGVLATNISSRANAAGTLVNAKSAWSDGMQVNPNIDNLRVALMRDLEMVTDQEPIDWSFSNINSVVNRDTVHANMDTMAQWLAQKSTADEAWSTIFQKPDSKSWALVKVALKVNCIEPKQMPKLSIVEKICIELNRLGVPYANMIVWDGVHNADGTDKYTPYKGDGLPEGVIVSKGNNSLGGREETQVPAPWSGTANCTKHIADGTIDILVNFAVNKGHSDSRGRTTLSMKNHFGTFDPSHGHENDSATQFDYLISINKSDAILGGEVPRQQLVVMDSIYAMTHGPTGKAPNFTPGVLLMGTFGPAVDYATVKLIREEEMDYNHSAFAETFITSFGYSQTVQDDFINKSPLDNNGLGVMELSPGMTFSKKPVLQNTNTVYLHVIAGKYYSAAVPIAFSSSDRVRSAAIYSVGGKKVRELDSSLIGDRGLSWDGKNDSGSWVEPGAYFVRVQGTNRTASARFSLR
ncbi:MAG: DUF362 domain-containing protein [Fibrobacteria bacterium]|nr:DUF362 domain-containing protein [Fibrobacteria bacterium]